MNTEGDRNRAYWNRNAKNYDRSMALLGRPLVRMAELAGQAVRGAQRVLEVGAGTGLVTTALAAEAGGVVATDYADTMVTTLKARVEGLGIRNVQCEQADLHALRFEAGSFDAVVAANVLHLVPDVPAALAALQRVLKPGGLLVLPTFCHDETAPSWMVSRLLAVTGFPSYRRFTVRSLQECLKAAGLRMRRSEALPGLIPIGYVDGILG